MNMKLALILSLAVSALSIPFAEAQGAFFRKKTLGDAYKGKLVGAQSDLVQVKVMRQSEHGSTGASCAYHALRNGILLALASVQAEDYLERLQSADHMRSLIAYPGGQWRSIIILDRLRLIAHKIICKELMKSFHGARVVRAKEEDGGYEFNEKVDKLIFDAHNPAWNQDELNRLVNDTKNICSKFMPEIENGGLHYTIDSDDVFEKFAALFANNVKNTEQDEPSYALYRALQEGGREKFDTYFGDIDLDFTITMQGKVQQGDKKIKHKYKIERELNGDWLGVNEPALIIRHEIENGLLKDAGIDIAVYGSVVEPVCLKDFITLRMNEKHAKRKTKNKEPLDKQERKAFRKKLRGIYPQFKEKSTADQIGEDMNAIKDKVRNNEDFVGLVLVYLGGDISMSSVIDSSDSSEAGHAQNLGAQTDFSHWIPLVIIASNNHRQYIVADSMANTNRLHNPTIHKIITYLEGSEQEYEDEHTAKKKGSRDSRKKSSSKSKNVETASDSDWSFFSIKSALTVGAAVVGGWALMKVLATNK